MARKSYIVTAAGLVARMTNDTGEGYLYRGAAVPDAVSAEECERLLELGLIAEDGTEEAQAAEAPTGPAEPPAGGSAPTALDDMNLAQLRDYATEKGISLDGVDSRKVTEIRAAITKAEQA